MSATSVALGLANLLLLAALIACCCRRRKYPGQVLSTRVPGAPAAAPAPYPQQHFAPAPYPVASSYPVQSAVPYLAGPAAPYLAGPAGPTPQPCSAPFHAAPYPPPFHAAPYQPVAAPYPETYPTAPSAPESHLPFFGLPPPGWMAPALPPSYEQATGVQRPLYNQTAQ